MPTKVAHSPIGRSSLQIKRGERVLRLLGYKKVKADGRFDRATLRASRDFEKHFPGLGKNGAIDKQQLLRMRQVLRARKNPGSGPTLKDGFEGAPVKQLQRRLRAMGFGGGKVTGEYSRKTATAVKRFEHAFGMAKPDGVADKKTWKWLGIDAKGRVRDPNSGSAFARKVLTIARTQLGTHEVGSNGQKYSRFFGRSNEAWCADFVSWCYTHAGKRLNIPYTPTLLAEMQRHKDFNRNNPKPGQIVIFDWSPSSGVPAEHTGLVERVFQRNGRRYVQTIEGNSGNMVRRRLYSLPNAQIRGFSALEG